MLHELVRTWLGWVDAWGYTGVFLLMALESSIIPVPSEIVVPPAAFWAAQGRMDFGMVILVATLGSYVGSAISYFVSKQVGLPVIRKYGKYFLLSEEKLNGAQVWVEHYGAFGIFVSRLLPVVRHLISIPAGVVRMSFIKFSAATLAGAAIWCSVLAWFGREVIGAQPELLNSPEALTAALKAKLHWIVAGVLVLTVLYVGVQVALKSARRRKLTAPY